MRELSPLRVVGEGLRVVERAGDALELVVDARAERGGVGVRDALGKLSIGSVLAPLDDVLAGGLDGPLGAQLELAVGTQLAVDAVRGVRAVVRRRDRRAGLRDLLHGECLAGMHGVAEGCQVTLGRARRDPVAPVRAARGEQRTHVVAQPGLRDLGVGDVPGVGMLEPLAVPVAVAPVRRRGESTLGDVASGGATGLALEDADKPIRRRVGGERSCRVRVGADCHRRPHLDDVTCRITEHARRPVRRAAARIGVRDDHREGLSLLVEVLRQKRPIRALDDGAGLPGLVVTRSAGETAIRGVRDPVRAARAAARAATLAVEDRADDTAARVVLEVRRRVGLERAGRCRWVGLVERAVVRPIGPAGALLAQDQHQLVVGPEDRRAVVGAGPVAEVGRLLARDP